MCEDHLVVREDKFATDCTPLEVLIRTFVSCPNLIVPYGILIINLCVKASSHPYVLHYFPLLQLIMTFNRTRNNTPRPELTVRSATLRNILALLKASKSKFIECEKNTIVKLCQEFTKVYICFRILYPSTFQAAYSESSTNLITQCIDLMKIMFNSTGDIERRIAWTNEINFRKGHNRWIVDWDSHPHLWERSEIPFQTGYALDH